MGRQFDPAEIPKHPNLNFEKQLWDAGLQLVAGADEAGRGALAGPVAAAVLLLPVDPDLCQKLPGVHDSKKMSPQARQLWAERIIGIAVDYGVGFASNLEIDDLGILPATHLAVRRALDQLVRLPQHLLVDYMPKLQLPLPVTQLVKGDARSLSIAGASILAKTSRDACMCQLDKEFSDYGFCQHKGYGTEMHRRILARLGPSAAHRRSFSYQTAGFAADAKHVERKLETDGK